MKAGVLIALLFMAALVWGSSSSKNGRQMNNMDMDLNQDDRAYSGASPKPFHAGFEYTFEYNAQIAAGIVAPDASSEPSEPEQNAVQRLQAKAKIAFSSDRHAQLILEGIRIGELNEQIPEPEQVQPMRIFEQKRMPSEEQRLLQLPAVFIYVDGVIERIQFHAQDQPWSKNIKRAVLNMIQLNLKRNNAQSLRMPEELSNEGQSEEYGSKNSIENQCQSGLCTFSLPEITIEGECQTTYTVSKPRNGEQNSRQQNSGEQQFNVTKSIDFKKCRKVADVAYGFQTQQQQQQCAECQKQWYKQQFYQNTQNNGQSQNRDQPSPCDVCDPKEVKEQKLERSTVLRFVLAGTPGSEQKQALRRTELISHYVFKSLNSETSPSGNSAAMHTTVASELIFRDVQQKTRNVAEPRQSSDKDETLLFSNAWDVDTKRFYMFGDEEYARNSPFKEVENKQSQAEQALRKIVQSASDKQQGIEVEAPLQLQRLVDVLRMCSVEELEQIHRSTTNGRLNAEEKQKATQILIDALAIAGTRNTIKVLVEKIQNKEVSTAKAVHALKTLAGLPAPSDSQVQMVMSLCQNEIAQRSQPLKQSCWLTAGAMINELCQHKTQKVAQQSVFGAQSGFDSEEICPLDKKQNYREVLKRQLKTAESTYEKILALKAIGNAGLDITVLDLEETIKDKSEERIVRFHAMDAMRRLRQQMPRKIQTIALPVFLNNRESPELRTAAFAIIMQTLPSQPIIDQIAYTLTKERSQHVLAFVYNSMKSLANSQNPIQQQMAEHIKTALKLANVDDQTLPKAGRFQLPLFSQIHQEGVFLNLVSTYSNQGMLPIHLSAGIDSLLNGEFQKDTARLSFTQKSIEQWYVKAMRAFQNYYNSASSSMLRGERRSGQGMNQGQTPRNIYSALGIKSRRSQSNNYDEEEQVQQSQQQPFAMFNLRIADVDQAILPIDEQMAPQFLKKILQGEKSSLAQLFQNADGHHYQSTVASNLNEKFAHIPTSMGLPLKIAHSMPSIATLDARIQVNGNGKINLKFQPAVNVAHLQKMEIWTPMIVTGVQSLQSVEVNLPVQCEINTQSQQHGLEIKLQVPKTKVQLAGFHSLPTTYTAQFDSKQGTKREPKLKTVRVEQLEQRQRDVNAVYGAQNGQGLPVHIKGHYHRAGQPTNYAEYIQLALASENQLHVTFQPNQQTPDEIILRANAGNFQRISAQAPELDQFYSSNSGKFNAIHDEDFEDMDLENQNERRQKLNKFLGQYRPSQMYQHSLKMSAQTVGGQQECKAQMQVQSKCDSKFQYCKLEIDAEKSPAQNGNGKWTLNSKIQVVRPESVSSISELSELSDKNAKFVCQMETQWGTSQLKQELKVQIQGEQAKKQQWRQHEEDQSRTDKYYKRRTSFLNKFDLEADYKLSPEMQNAFGRALEALKSYNFWNTQSKLQHSQGEQRNGQVYATLIIDPITQKHANVSVKTPSQLVRIESMELPCNVRPFSLVRPLEKSTHSVSQLVNRWSVKSRAECQVDGRRVETFDDVVYSSPISTCYSVLAKDCSIDEDDSEDQPQFVVLMKSLQKDGQAKKIKVVTPHQTIECQPKQQNQDNNKQQKLQCKINGQAVNEHGNDDEENTVEFNNAQNTDVTINVNGVSVRFNGQKAWIKISSHYKNSQCGICGHYDDESDDELRMNNNQLTSDIEQFHRSYSLMSTQGEDEECSQLDQDNFYSQNKAAFNRRNNIFGDNNNDDDDSQWNGQNNDDEEWEDQGFSGDDDWMPKSNGYKNGQKSNFNRRYSRNENTKRPVEQTKVVETGDKVCFSQQTVKSCPKGTVPAASNSDYGSDEDQEQAQKTKKVKFACISRSSPDARRFLRQAREGRVLDVSELSTSFQQVVKQPTECMRF
jgi:hypothetical protein